MEDRHSVLVVDDRKPDLDMITRYLREIPSWNFDLNTATEASGAEQKLRETDVDLIVLDHKLSSETGVDFLARENVEPSVPVVVVSGYLPSEEALKLYEEASYTYLDKKSLSPEQLRMGISNALERYRLESQLQESLQHQKTLLREIHHRVKNNMQTISSLLDLQVRNIDHGETQRRLKQSQRRIRSMARVHEILYQSEDLSGLDIAEYLRDLVEAIRESLGATHSEVRVECDLESGVSLDQQTAIACGLITNELVTNAFQHAAGNGEGGGQIRLEFTALNDEQYQLTVEDDGPGLPENFNLREVDSLGLLLVQSLTEDELRGSLDLESGNGTRVQVTFPPPNRGT